MFLKLRLLFDDPLSSMTVCFMLPDRTAGQGPRTQPDTTVGRSSRGPGRIHQHPGDATQLGRQNIGERADESERLHGATHGGHRRLDAASQLSRRQRRMRECMQSFRSDAAPSSGALRIRRRRENPRRQGSVR